MDFYFDLYDNYYIATEGFSDVKNTMVHTIQNLITRLLAFLKRLLYNLYRIKKVSLPQEIYNYIVDMDKALVLITDGIDSGRTDPDSAATLLDMIKTNKKFTQIMYSTRDNYVNSKEVNVDTRVFVRQMKDINKQLTNKQVELNNLRYDNSAADDVLATTDIYVKILQYRLNVNSKIFTFHKNSSDITPLDNATIADDYKL